LTTAPVVPDSRRMGKQFTHAPYVRNSPDFRLFAYDPRDSELGNLAHVQLAMDRIVALLNDPDALGARVMALRSGTAKAIEGL
jgi:hypothetical protein